jgi:hypothetical protein
MLNVKGTPELVRLLLHSTFNILDFTFITA